MRYWWYSNKLGGFSNVTGEPPIENNYKFIGMFDKEVNINSNMYLLKCTDSEVSKTQFKNPFTPHKQQFSKADILKLYESMSESDKIIVHGSRNY